MEPVDHSLRVAANGAGVADRLRDLDTDHLLTVLDGPVPGPVALVVSLGGNGDVVLPDLAALDEVWTRRVGPFARWFAGLAPPPRTPPVLADHDPRLPVVARRLLDRLRAHLGPTRGETFDHIGSTSVPGLRAKRFVDLQVGVPALPERGSAFDDVVACLGFLPARGSRPDSPGVDRDDVIDPAVDPALYRKRLYVRLDPEEPVILHVRRTGSPWCSATTRFRDRLRADPAFRRAYEEVKERAAREHADDDDDYDDYTRAKSGFIRSGG